MAALAGAAAIAGYVMASHPRLPAALIGLAALAAWAAFSWRAPRAALSCAFVMVLLAGTKFRFRDAAASLDAVIDGQIAMELALYGAIGLTTAIAWIARGERPRLTGTETALLAYATLALLSTVWSLSPTLTFVRASQLCILLAFACTSVRVLSPGRALWIACGSLAIYVLLCATLAAVFPSFAGPDTTGGPYRFAWFSLRAVGAGTLAGLAALASLSSVLYRPPHPPGPGSADRRFALRAGLAAGTLALVAVLVLTKARGPMLAFAAGAAVLLFTRMPGSLRAPLVFTGTTVLLIALYAAPDLEGWLDAGEAQSSAWSTLVFRDQRADAVIGLSGRVELWDEVRPLIADRALLGHGYQGSRALLLDIASWAGYAHNAFLQTLLDLGLAGILALGGVLAAALAAPYRASDRGAHAGDRRWLRATAASTISFLLLNAMTNESFSAAPGIELLLVFLCALSASTSEGLARCPSGNESSPAR